MQLWATHIGTSEGKNFGYGPRRFRYLQAYDLWPVPGFHALEEPIQLHNPLFRLFSWFVPALNECRDSGLGNRVRTALRHAAATCAGVALEPAGSVFVNKRAHSALTEIIDYLLEPYPPALQHEFDYIT